MEYGGVIYFPLLHTPYSLLLTEISIIWLNGQNWVFQKSVSCCIMELCSSSENPSIN